MTATRPSPAPKRDTLLRLVSPESAEGPAVELPRLPGRGLYTEEARRERLDWMRQRTGRSLDALAQIRLNAERLTQTQPGIDIGRKLITEGDDIVPRAPA